MRTTHAVSLLVLSLVMAIPLSARAAGLITGVTPSANPVDVNTDVTFTVKGMSGGCPEVILDFGDGQRATMTKVQFNKKRNATSPAHKYAVARAYTVKATPGRGCTGSAMLNLVVTSPLRGGGGGGDLGGDGGGDGGGIRGRFDRNAVYNEPAARMRSRAGTAYQGSALPAPPSPCPQIKAKFDAALDWAMKGARPDVCDYTIWDSGCENVFKAVGSCNANNCPEKCHQQDTLMINIYQCGNANVFKQLVNSYSGMSQEARDACLARLERAGL